VRFNAVEDIDAVEVLSQESDILLRRIGRERADDDPNVSITVLAASERPTPNGLNRLAREYELAEYLDYSWALRPLELVRENGQTILIFEDPGGELLSQLLGMPMEIERFLRLAIGITAAVSKMHQRGLVHKDIKPANVLVNSRDREIRLTGFGIASRIPRERQPPGPPHFIAGTLAYMAPEQTGRMNRSIDSRSDLYALGVTFYQMLTGSLPFDAVDAMEWIHCHIARQARAPRERASGIPDVLSSIVMKLLAKTVEERYQTAGGIEADLRRCLMEWQLNGRIEPFPLAAQDISDQLLIPERLYGREREIATLLASFDRVVAQGTPELVLISGYSGVGKSSVVNELHKVLVPPRGLFAAGKFDQYKRDIPYATLAQAFQQLIHPILAKSEAELDRWRESLLHALEPHGDLIVNLVPELKLIIGEQEPVPELPAPDAQRRFQLLLRRFIGVFARPEHPLALFLDDLQWLDAATLDLLEDLLTQESVPYLLLIGAYRDNEVDVSHPLMRKLGSIKAAGTSSVEEITLGALDDRHVSQLIADALHSEADRVGDLASLILQKTDGNPFFINQFLSALTDEGLLAFDSVHSRWSWDLKRIHAKGYTDNVADLMISKIVRLPAVTQQALQQLACLGNVATTAMLATVHDITEQELHASLVEARRQELVDFLDSSYRFVHDRVHEAAYALIPIERRAAMHLRIGKMLVAHTPPGKLEEAIFEIVNQLNRASSLVTAREEREQLAEFNLLAGRRAQASSAHVSALNYLTTGAALLTDDGWQQRRELRFALELARAHCEFASGTIAEAEERLRSLSIRAVTAVELAAVTCLQVDLYQGVGRSDEAVAVGLCSLRQLGVDFPEHPTEADAQRAYDGIWIRLGARAIEDLINLPRMSDPDSLAALELLISVAIPSKFFGSPHLFAMILCTAVALGLERGHSDASCFAYAQLGSLATHLGEFDAGYRFGRLGCELVEQPGWQRFQARTFQTFGIVVPWTQPMRKAREFLLRGFDLASRIGEISYAGYACNQLNTNYLVAGDPLSEAQEQAEHALAFVRKVGSRTVEASILGQLGLIRCLRGLTVRLGAFDDAAFSESDLERELAGNPALALSECWYYIRKLQARFLAGEYPEALQAAFKAQPMVGTSALPLFEFIEYHFYDALCRAAVHETASSEDREYHFARLTEHLGKLDTWALHCPENFANRAALVGAEVARIEGREVDAERLYERAISSARASDLVHNEALANELAGQFYLARGFGRIANAYFREARDCYLRWGADGKVQQLDRLYPHLADPEGQRPATIIGSPVQHLDVASVVKASQALSSEIVLPKLIEQLMKIAIENAGADRGLLILPSGDEYLIQAEARATGDQIEVTMRQEPITGIMCPESLVRYVIRTRESVILDDASKPNLFSGDDYLRDRQSKSILCLPLMKQRELTGILLLENALISHAFTPARIAVLKLLALQAAISLENTRLYGDLAQAEKALSASERDLKSIIDTMPALAWSAGVDASGEFFNQHYIDYVGLSLHQLQASGWQGIVHPDDLGGLRQTWQTTTASGRAGEAEGRLRRADGEYRWFLIRWNPVHDIDGKIVKWYGANTDIDERKRAEEKAFGAERELQRTIDSIPALAATYDADGSRMSVNKLGLDFSGLSAEDVTSGRWIIAIHPDDIEISESKWAACVASGKPFEHEYRTRAADGTYRWHVARRVPMRDETGKVIRWYGVSHDIEDRKRAEALLAGEKRVLEMIASGRPLRHVLEALCQFFEEAAINCFCGIYPIDGHSATFQYGVAPSLPASYTDPIEGLPVDSDDSPRGQSISEKEQVIAEDIGSDPRWAEAPCRPHVLEHGLRAVWSTPISSGEGTVIGTVCVYQQKPGSPSPYHQELIAHVARLASIAIERSQAETARRLSEFYLTEGQRISVTGTFSWQVDTDELSFSEELNRIFEFEPNTDPTFDQLGERVHPDDLPLLAHNQALVRAGLDNPEYEIRLRMPDGRLKWMLVFARVTRHKDGRLECLGAVQDITRRRLAEESRDRIRSELAHVSRVVSLGALTASIAHEVNQPLASIVTNGETGLRWLVRPEPNLAKVEDLIKRVVKDARRAAEIIDRTRAMAGRGSTERSVVMLAEIITESTAFLHHEFQARGVSVSLDLAPDLPAVFGDRTQLQQVIVNLVVNAVQALTVSEAVSKNIAIRAQQIDAETVRCIVEDSGSGVDAEHLPHLFDNFFTTKETGMGLGLPIAQSIIEAHNGRIRVDNESALGGARFVFELPMLPPSSAGSARPSG
jgi:PAS domain S-box-containing protein